MTTFLVVFEKSTTGYGAYAPDLPGCAATGRTLEETRKRMAKAMELHLSAMREDGDSIPEPSHFELVKALSAQLLLPLASLQILLPDRCRRRPEIRHNLMLHHRAHQQMSLRMSQSKFTC